MSWETRDGKGAYYTRSKRERGRIVREYVGCDRDAELVASLDAAERAAREADVVAWRERKARTAELDGMIADIVRATDELVTAALLGAGFYQHHREWRRRGG